MAGSSKENHKIKTNFKVQLILTVLYIFLPEYFTIQTSARYFFVKMQYLFYQIRGVYQFFRTFGRESFFFLSRKTYTVYLILLLRRRTNVKNVSTLCLATRCSNLFLYLQLYLIIRALVLFAVFQPKPRTFRASPNPNPVNPVCLVYREPSDATGNDSQ